MKRVLIGLLAGGWLLGAAIPVAAAQPPVGGCPPPVLLQANSDFGPGVQDHQAGVDKNRDGHVCTQPLPEALPFPNINFIDNVVRQ